MKVNKEENVEKFLETVQTMKDLDPDVMRKLTKRKYQVGASLQSRPVNIWSNQEEDEEDKVQKRSHSIQVELPVLNCNKSPEEFGPVQLAQDQKDQAYYRLTKAEKKQIKKDLLKFTEKSKEQSKEGQQKIEVLIKSEEAWEASLCKDSQASNILNDHKNKAKKKTDQQNT